jgi:hypothetical protein
MNQWVYDGFATTYKNLGVDFDCFTEKEPIWERCSSNWFRKEF